MIFRPYQLEYINNIQLDKSNLLIATMRAGKSLILKGIIDKYFQGKKVLILVGIRHVIEQLATYYDDYSFILAGKPFDHSKHIHLATFQTLQRRDIDLSEYDMICIDEIHMRFNTTIVKEIRKLSCTRIYMTGTPLKSNNTFLSDEFDNILEFTNVRQMIDDGYLAPTKFMALGNMLSDESQLSVQNGDYVNADIDRIIDRTALIQWIVADDSKYNWSTQHKAIMYTNSIATTERIVTAFNSPNVRAIHSKLSKSELESVMNWFESTPNGIIVNCRMLTVGVDIPSADTVIYLLPTMIHSLFLQSIFRASTKYGDKQATVYDYSGMLNKVNPYSNEWRKAKLSCKDQCAKQYPTDPLAQYFCIESCTSNPILVPCIGKLSPSLAEHPFISNYTVFEGKPCMESRPVWEYEYKSQDISLGLIRKWSKCRCGCVTFYDLKTLTDPVELIQVYDDSKPFNTVSIIYSPEHHKALAVFDDITTTKYRILMFDSSEELYKQACDFFKSKPFQILSSHAMPKLPNVSVDKSLLAAEPAIKWESDNKGFIRHLIKAKLTELVSFFGMKPGYVYFNMKNVNDGNQKSVLNFLNSSRIDRSELLKFFSKLQPKE